MLISRQISVVGYEPFCRSYDHKVRGPDENVSGGTRYACHIDDKGDLTCLPYQFCFGPGLPVIFSYRD